jgi:hypothetical protein
MFKLNALLFLFLLCLLTLSASSPSALPQNIVGRNEACECHVKGYFCGSRSPGLQRGTDAPLWGICDANYRYYCPAARGFPSMAETLDCAKDTATKGNQGICERQSDMRDVCVWDIHWGSRVIFMWCIFRLSWGVWQGWFWVFALLFVVFTLSLLIFEVDGNRWVRCKLRVWLLCQAFPLVECCFWDLSWCIYCKFQNFGVWWAGRWIVQREDVAWTPTFILVGLRCFQVTFLRHVFVLFIWDWGLEGGLCAVDWVDAVEIYGVSAWLSVVFSLLSRWFDD